MNYFRNYHILRDPIHGFIKINDYERELINSSPFQRLRNIKQLAFTSYVYHGAEHSRFGHSLGVMEFATKIFDTLVEKHRNHKQVLLNWSEDRIDKNRRLLRLAALFHDLGHPPFSHASEGLLPNNLEHEDYTAWIIESEEINSIIETYKDETQILTTEISAFFKRENISKDSAFLSQILKGDFDADRMDYLLRDSLYTGVHYGKFDHERLIHTLCLIKDEEGNLKLAIEEGGVHALEAMIIARYFMFTQVYFHKTRRAYDYHLTEFLKKEIENYPESVNEYLEWDDIKVLTLMRNKIKENDHARRILERRHFREAFLTPEHPKNEEVMAYKWLKKEIVEKHKGVILFFDISDKAPHKFEKVDFTVVTKMNDKKPLLEYSGIMNNLKPIKQYRIYVTGEKKEEVEIFCKKFWEENIFRKQEGVE